MSITDTLAEQYKKCKVIERRLHVSQDQKSMTLVFDALNTFNRKVSQERFIRSMGGWAGSIARDPEAVATRKLLLQGKSFNLSRFMPCS